MIMILVLGDIAQRLALQTNDVIGDIVWVMILVVDIHLHLIPKLLL